MLTIGADPEFFIMSAKSGKPVPIIGKLGGTKDEPFRKPEWMQGYAVQEDNVMAEFNIPACTEQYEFMGAIDQGRKLVMSLVGRSYKPYPACFAKFDHETLRHPQALRFGCSPDNDGYNLGKPHELIKAEQLNEEDGGWRFAGGHVHLGYRDDIPWIPPFVMAAMSDAFIAIPLIQHKLDPQGPRRRFYGLPGRFRQTSYGIEYRTLGNGWTENEVGTDRVGRMAFYMLQMIREASEKTVRGWYHEFPWVAIRECILNEDARAAHQLWNAVSHIIGGGKRRVA